MIDIDNVKREFNEFINQYENQDDPSFKLKVVHTMHVVENAKMISTTMNLGEEDRELAQTIAYLHDLGRFEELKELKGFESVKNDHALYASKILFENNLIRKFVSENTYDEVIKKAIENHNKFDIEAGLSERELLHAKLIRDADKLDNFRVKNEESIEALFPGKISKTEEFNNSLISDKVYESVINNECVNIKDRVYPLDYWICILAFAFDLNFKESFEIVKKNDYINVLINKFDYTNSETKERVETIRNTINDYIEKKSK